MTVEQSLSRLTTREGNLINHIWLDSRWNEALGERGDGGSSWEITEAQPASASNADHIKKGENDGRRSHGIRCPGGAQCHFSANFVVVFPESMSGKHYPSHTWALREPPTPEKSLCLTGHKAWKLCIFFSLLVYLPMYNLIPFSTDFRIFKESMVSIP